MQPSRIVLADGSRFLHEMLKRVIEKTPDLQVVSEIADLARLSSTIAETEAEWVIVSLPPDGNMPELVDSALAAHSSVRFLAMATDGSQVRIKWLESHEEPMGDVSLNELIAVLRRHRPVK